MRAKILMIALLMGVAVLQPRLAWADGEITLSQRWAQLTAVVKQTVTEYWNKWVGSAKDQQSRGVASAPPPQTPAAPAAANSVGTPATPMTPAQAPAQAGARVTGAGGAPAAPSPADQIKQVRQALKSQGAFETKTAGRAHGANLKTTKKTHVPIYDFKKIGKVKSIPLLDVGQEPEISRRNFSLPNWDWGLVALQEAKKLPSPALITAKDLTGVPQNIAKAGPMKLSPNEKSLIDSKVTREKIDKIDYKITDEQKIDVKPFEAMSEDQVKMLVTKILFDRGDRCPVVLGLADELSAKPEFRTEALFELGSCAKRLNLNQVTFDKLSEVIKKQDSEFGPKALPILAKNLPVVYEQPFYELVKNLEGKEEYFADKKVKDEIYYRTAKGAFRAGHYKAAEKWAAKVDPSSSFSPSARYVVAISQYGAKERSAARATLESLAQDMQNSSDDTLKGLVNVDLARMDFTARKYEQALPLYLKVPKDHPLWVSALIEQGWTQLAVDDFAGAIGNMYSLHSPYFKILYQPQSFVVRTIGYLNICQYGDAYRTLTKLETDYRDWENRLTAYLSNGRTPASVYETVKTYLRSKSNTDVQGLPYQLVREAARGKTFLSLQEAINQKSDELGLFSGINAKISKEKANVRIRADQAKHRAAQLAAKLAVMKAQRAPAAQIADLKQRIEHEKSRSVPNRYELAILEQSQKAFGHFQKTAQAKISDSERRLHADASQALYDRMKAMKTEIARTLDNNEFLRYEIFAGSGENIRYQVAGGQVGGENRLPASVKPQKMMNWTFDGEFWADEIGNYRSSLKNNCPKTGRAGSGDQARGE